MCEASHFGALLITPPIKVADNTGIGKLNLASATTLHQLVKIDIMTKPHILKMIGIIATATALSACNTETIDTLENNNQPVTDTSTTAPADNGTDTNAPPTISGAPLSSVMEGITFNFTPTASDPDGDTLRFSVANLPAWATFNTATGRVSGTPGAADVGVYNGVTITVTDGTTTANLTPFTVEVIAANGDLTAPQISGIQVNSNSTSSTTISWETDEPASSTLNYGMDTSYGNVQTNASLSTNHSYTLTGLTAGATYHYQITVVDAASNETSSADASFTLPSPITTPSGSWEPPIGIRAPEFGIEESHTMYENALYDFGNGTVPYPDAGNGPYTHYVDNQHPNATDSNNPYGTPNKPRMTIPLSLSPGSVVEVHNGPYSYTESIHGDLYLPLVEGYGTADKPIFIRGANSSTPFEIGELGTSVNEIIVRDYSYVILENVFINGPAIKIYQPTTHFAIRHSEITGETTSGIKLWSYKLDFVPGEVKDNIVIYNNKIHDNGPYPASAETGRFGVIIDNASEDVWVVDNDMYYNGDDSLQVIDRYWVPELRGIIADGIYIGRNKMHHDGENAIDIKGSKNVIISQNEIYGYLTLYSTSAGEAIRINDEGEQDNIWLLYNRIYDSEDGIDPVNALFKPYIIGNVIHNVDTAINRDGAIVTNNTIYNCTLGVGRRRGPYYELSNNIITNCDTAYDYCSSCGTDVTYSNILYNNGSSRACTDCIYDDPQMEADNETPSASSPAVDAAGQISEAYDIFFNTYGLDIRRDIDNKPRPSGGDWDIGAHEINGPSTP